MSGDLSVADAAERRHVVSKENMTELRAAVEELRSALGLPPLRDRAFGEKLRSVRKERGVSLRSLAARVGVSPAYVSKIENAQISPPSETVIRSMARVLEADEWEFLLLGRKLPSELLAALLELPAEELRELFVNRVVRLGAS